MRSAILTTAFLLGGCAMSAAGIKKGSIERTWVSQKEPQQVAGCLASKLIGSNPVFQDEDGHYVVARNNGYGIPTTRYDVFKEGNQTRIDLRSTISINRGTSKLEECL